MVMYWEEKETQTQTHIPSLYFNDLVVLDPSLLVPNLSEGICIPFDQSFARGAWHQLREDAVVDMGVNHDRGDDVQIGMCSGLSLKFHCNRSTSRGRVERLEVGTAALRRQLIWEPPRSIHVLRNAG